MARKTVKEYQPRSLAGWVDGERHFNTAEMAVVMAAAAPGVNYARGSAGALLYRSLKRSLDYAGLTFELRRSAQERPTQDAVHKEFAKIEAAARRLLAALHAPRGVYEELPPSILNPLRAAAVKLVKVRQEQENQKMQSELKNMGGPGRLQRLPTEIEAVGLLRASLDGVQNLCALATALAAQTEPSKESAHQVKHETDAAEDGFVKHLMWIWLAHLRRTDVTSKEFRRFAYAAMKVVVSDVKPHAIRGRVTRLLKTPDFLDFTTVSTNQLKKRLDL